MREYRENQKIYLLQAGSWLKYKYVMSYSHELLLFFVSIILKIVLKKTRLENVEAIETAVKRVLENIPKTGPSQKSFERRSKHCVDNKGTFFR